jgi:hypothetical protein
VIWVQQSYLGPLPSANDTSILGYVLSSSAPGRRRGARFGRRRGGGHRDGEDQSLGDHGGHSSVATTNMKI